MTKEEIEKIVTLTVDKILKNKHKENKSPFQLTELYIEAYKNMDESIQIKLDTIKELREEVSSPKISKIVPDVIQGGVVENTSQLEKRERSIEYLLTEIEELTMLKLQIEKVMDKFKKNENFRIIQERFFNNKTFEEIGDMFGVDESTVRRRKNKIIKEMSVILFPVCAERPPKVRLEITE